MTVREWVSATWAEWCPAFSDGRFDFGPLVIMSRRELASIVRKHQDLGRQWERRDPTPDPQPDPMANVRFLNRA